MSTKHYENETEEIEWKIIKLDRYNDKKAQFRRYQ
jgi:hypothetical protein